MNPPSWLVQRGLLSSALSCPTCHAPGTERQAREEELAELPAQLAAYQSELAVPAPTRERREWLEWKIRAGTETSVGHQARLQTERVR